jgi:hypothetical protein
MLLRPLVLLLVLANAAWFAWTQGYLRPWGLAPVQQSEPHRLAEQIQPEALRVLRPDEVPAATAVTGASRAPECLATAPLDEARAAAVSSVLAGWPAGSWTLEAATEPGRWIVYMGKYLIAEQVERKKAELRQRGVSFEPVTNRALEPGLSLGGFASQALAQQHLDALAARGVRTATVMQERPELQGMALRLPRVDEALASRLEPLRAALAGQALRACR